MKLNIRLPDTLLPSAVGTILDSKWSNRFGRYREFACVKGHR